MQTSILEEIERATAAGIARAQRHADQVHNNKWTSTAYAFFIGYVMQSNQPFTVEDARHQAEATGLVPPPHSNRAWGAIARMAKNDKLIRACGYRPSSQKNCHAGTLRLWAKAT